MCDFFDGYMRMLLSVFFMVSSGVFFNLSGFFFSLGIYFYNLIFLFVVGFMVLSNLFRVKYCFVFGEGG